MKTNHILHLSALISLAIFATSCDDDSCSSDSVNPLQSQTVFVATDRHDVGNGNNLKALVQMVSQNMTVAAPNIYFLGGDNAGQGSMRDSLAAPPYSLFDVWKEIAAGAGNKDFRFFSTYGSHDGGCLSPYNDFFSGPMACQGFYLYGISYAQVCFAVDSLAKDYIGLDRTDAFGLSAETGSAKFLRWIATLNDNAPIIVMTHVPLHANRHDNPGAEIWAEALNKAAESHDVFVLFGHNHTTEEGILLSPSLDPSGNPINDQDYYMVLPGSPLAVQTADKQVWDTLTVNFTYMNAGYLKLGYASTFTLKDDDYDGKYETFLIKRHTINDTIITHFGNTSNPNPTTLSSRFGKR